MSVEGKQMKSNYIFFGTNPFDLGVRMGRIPKLVKEKALAEHRLSSSSIDNDDSSLSIPSSSPSIVPSINSNSNNFTSTEFELPLIDEQLFFNESHSISLDNPLRTLPSCTNHGLHDNFTFEENLNSSNHSDLINCEKFFANNSIERIKNLVRKISYATTHVELDDEESLFIRYLRWKMFDLCNTYNGCRRQLIPRMDNMNSHGVNK